MLGIMQNQTEEKEIEKADVNWFVYSYVQGLQCTRLENQNRAYVRLWDGL